VDDVGEPWCPAEPNYDRPVIAEYYSISYMYLGTLGLSVTLIVGTITSFFVYLKKRHSPCDLPKGVLFPAIDRMFKRREQEEKTDTEKTYL